MKRRGLLGFTLTELMIVIGIIIAIAAILFPVFSTSIDKVRQARCLSNQKQLAQAMIMYSNDHDEALPPFGDRTPDSNHYWNTSLHPYTRGSDLLFCPKGSKTNYSIGVNYGQLFRYSYTLSQSNGTWVYSPPVYLGTISDPTRKILLGDSRSGMHMYTPKIWFTDKDHNNNGNLDSNSGVLRGGTPYNNVAIDRHSNGLNITFLDGHTKWYSGETILNSIDLW